MKMTAEHRAERIAATRGAAIALIEDLPHIREIVAKIDPSPGELRRLSGVLRRILHERDLSIVSAPRIGRILLLGPDNNPFVRSSANLPIPFFMTGGTSVFGVWVFGGMMERLSFGMSPERNLSDVDPRRQIELRLDNFLSQKVLCLEGQWASRGDVITFAANIASGVHSGTAKEPAHKLLERIRHSASFGTCPAPDGSTGVQIAFNIEAMYAPPDAFEYTPDRIDPILVELLCAAHFLTISPDVLRLEEIIKAELA